MISRILENLRVAFSGLGSNKLRPALTMLGVTIGVASVILLISLGQAVESFVQQQFLGLGTNLILVVGAENDQGVLVRPTMNDLAALTDPFRVPDATAVMPQYQLVRPISVEGRESSGRLRGVTPNFLQVRNRSIVRGRFFDQAEYDGMARVVVLGQDVAERMFPDTDPIGSEMRLAGINFEVIGILNETGGAGFAGNEDDILVLPVSTMHTRLSGERIMTGDRPVSSLWVQARDEDSIDLVAQQIRQTLREEHNINFRDEDDFAIYTQTDVLESSESITNLLTVFLAVLAGISLLWGGIGIMNIMLVTVTERTREIGLRKAVGAQNVDIQLQFVIEAMVLALVGGGIGIGLATLGTTLAGAALPELDIAVRLPSIVLATVISLAIGVFFGLYPASRAAKLNPIDALRYE